MSDARVAIPSRRVLRGDVAARVDDHAFAVVSELPTIERERPAPTGDHHVDALRAAAWDEGVALGRAAARDQGYDDGFEAGRAEGLAAGRAEGLAAGRATAAEEVAALVGGAVAALDAATTELARRDAVSLADIEVSVVDLAVGLAAAIIEHEVTLADEPGLDAIRRALRLAPERGDLVVRLNPADVATIESSTSLVPGRTSELVSDPSVGRGGCVVETESSQVDARIETALVRARAVLLDVDVATSGAADGTVPTA